ncbi:MAG: type II toxin-antitoxin system Phd/YefM family antitoxin [Candidatus Doudnabacteria bacterium]|nr:type II toxin-antitoxin system Phd/YefM family antitoxin [Candidatus Doudnabacteria bacterium]
MNSKTTLSITEARKRIFEICDAVQQPDSYYTLTENGKPKAVILSYAEYESIIETIDVMQEMPELGRELKETREAVKRGKHKNWTTLEELLAKQGYVLAEKAKKPYGFSSKTASKSRKTTK